MRKGMHYFLYVGLALLLGVMLNRGSGTRVSYAAPAAQTVVNVALGKPASQSSTYTADYPASRAVDGNTDGNHLSKSINHTNYDVNAWWQVDLGTPTAIASIALWNRTDCCSSRLTNFFVFVANYDMTGKGFGDLVVDNTVWRYSLGTTAPTTLNIPVNTTGRYVRVQLAGTNNLHLAEVQVFGTPGIINLAQSKPASQSSTFTADYPASRAVDGNTDGNHLNKSINHTNYDVNAWWQVDLGTPTAIASIALWNRTDCCSSRLTNFFVFVANYDMTGKGFGDLVVDNTVWRYSLGTAAPTPLNIPVSATGRYVRVQLAGTNNLHLAEVQVFGAANNTPSTGATVADGVYLVKAVHSGKCMEVAGAGTANGSNVQQWSCVPTAKHHQWQFTAVGNGYYKITNVNSGKVLDVAGISWADGANIYQWDNLNGSNQKWKPVSQGDGSYQLVAAHSNKCADVWGNATDGVNIAQHGCHTGANQRFTLTPVTATPPATTNLPEGIYLVKAVHSGKCMQVIGARLVIGVNTEQWNCDAAAKHQQWRFVAVGNGYYKIININSGKVLDVWGVSTADTMPLWQMDDLNRDNQKWKPVLQSDGSYQLVALHSNKCGTVTNAATADGAGIAQYPCGTGANQRFRLDLLAEMIVTNFEDNSLGMFTSGNSSSLTTDAESGQKAAIAPATGNTVSTRNAISPQTPITVIAWVKGIGTAYVSFARSNFSEISNSYRIVNSPTWQQITFAATAPIDTVAYDLAFRADNGAFLADNIVVILNERDTDNDSLSDRVESCSNLGGLNYEFYDISVAGYNLNNLPTTGALAKGVTADFDVQRLQNQFTPTDPHHYGLRYSGYLWITEAGQYTFFTNSDDGSLLSLDYRLVVNNDGTHPLTERSGTVYLYAGLHRFQLLYSAYTTPNSLAVQWSGPSFSKTALPFNRLLSCDPNMDTDQDGIPNVRDLDSDDDTIPDVVENSQ